MSVEKNIVLALKQVYDPEIPVNVYDLGLIYEIKVEEDGKASVKMTLTAPNCPMADQLLQDVYDAVLDVPGIKEQYRDWETLTNEIAQQAWKLFLEVEENGGFYAAIVAGNVQKAIKKTASTRLKNVSSRREVLLGTNQFPNFNEQAITKVQKDNNASSCCTHNTSIEQLCAVRAADEFESLRFVNRNYVFIDIGWGFFHLTVPNNIH